MRRPKWSHVTIALAVIAALAIASPVFGISKSIKKAIKKEVAKQVRNATGPAGTNGTNGTNGATNVVVREASSSTLLAAPNVTGASSTANCVGSERAVGGGAIWDEIVVNGMAIGQSTPTPTGAGSVPTGWLVTATNSTINDHHVRAKVVCASP